MGAAAGTRFGVPRGHAAHCLLVTREWRNGRRAVFRWQCPYGRGGSNPPSRTHGMFRMSGHPFSKVPGQSLLAGDFVVRGADTRSSGGCSSKRRAALTEWPQPRCSDRPGRRVGHRAQHRARQGAASDEGLRVGSRDEAKVRVGSTRITDLKSPESRGSRPWRAKAMAPAAAAPIAVLSDSPPLKGPIRHPHR